MTTSQRNSSIELLRIISIILIISMHVLGPYWTTTRLLNQEIIILVNAIGNMGVTLFVLISGYFGIHFRSTNFFRIVNLVLFYSLFSLLFLDYSSDTVTSRTILFSFLPISSSKYWFATSYIIIYCFSGFLNRIADSLTRKDFVRLLFIFGFFFVALPTLFYVEILDDYGKGPVNMTFIYLLGRYLGYYGFPQFLSRYRHFLFPLVLILPLLLHNLILVYTGKVFMPLYRDNSLFILLSSLYVFYFFVSRTSHSAVVNSLGSYCFAIYLAHGTFLGYWMFNPDSASLGLYFLSKILLLVVLSILVETLRRLLLGPLFSLLLRAEEHLLLILRQSSNPKP